MNSSNKKIIITGGSKGIGNHILKFFLKLNYKVLCLSRTKPKLKNKKLFFLKIDLSKKNQILKNKKRINNFDPDILINNVANIGTIGNFDKVNIQNWEKSFFLNFFAATYLTNIVLKRIIANNGYIFFMAGGGAANSFPGFSSYSIAKTALVRFVENLADENKGKLKTFILSPGPVNTRLFKDAKKGGHNISKKRFVSPKMTTNLINFILNNDTEFLSGRYIHVKDDYLSINAKNIKNFFLLRRLEKRRKF